MVPDRSEVTRQQRLDIGEPGGLPWPASDGGFELDRPHRTRRHAAVGRPQCSHFAAVALEAEGGNDGRNVLVEALGQFVDGELLARRKEGNADGGNDLARGECGLAVAGDEGLHREHAVAGARRQSHAGIERDQARNTVPDRRGRGEIAGDRSEVANLARSDSTHQSTEGRKPLIEMRQDFAVGDRTADLDRVGAGRDVTQLLDCFESDHRRQRLAILAHAQPQIGAARKQDGLRVLLHRREQRIERARREKGLRAAMIVGTWRHARQRFGQRGRLGDEAICGPLRDAPAGLHDRAIAGATAEIAGKRFMHGGAFGRLTAMMEGEHRHHETRRAEAALGGVGIDHRLLHRMERAVRCSQAFDREDGSIVDLRQHHQAGIHRLKPQRSVDLAAKDDRAGAAIAFGASFLRSGETCAGPQPVQHRHARRSAVLAAWLAVQQKLHRCHGRRLPCVAL